MADKTVQVKIAADSTELERAAARGEKSLTGMSGALAAFTAGAAAASLSLLARDLIDIGVASDKMRNSMIAATGSMAGLDFVRQEAWRLGLDVGSAAEAFTRLAAASRGTVLEGKQTEAIFSAVAGASTALGLSAEQTNGALTAIGQMMSKGTVQAEELRGQLGERIPGAFQIAARAMGMTTSELDAMLKKGQVVASDFLPKFAVELQRSFGVSEAAAHSAQAEINRFKTSVFDLKVQIMEGGGNDALKTLATSATELAREANDVWVKMGLVIDRAKELGGLNKAPADAYSAFGFSMGLLGLWRSKRAQAMTSPEGDDLRNLGVLEGGNLGENFVSGVKTPTSIAGKGQRPPGTRTPSSFFGQAWDESVAAADFESGVNTRFNTELSQFGGKPGELSIMGPGGASQWMTDATAARDIKWAFLDQQYQEELVLENNMYSVSRANREQDLAHHQVTQRMKMQTTTSALSFTQNALTAINSFTDGKSKVLFAMTKAVGVAQAIVAAHVASAQALASYPGPPWTIPLATSVLNWGYANAALTAAVSIGQGLSGNGAPWSDTSGGAAGSYGGGSAPYSPIVTQPVSSNRDTPFTLNLHFDGPVYGEDKEALSRWAEEFLAPTVKELVERRNVDFGR